MGEEFTQKEIAVSATEKKLTKLHGNVALIGIILSVGLLFVWWVLAIISVVVTFFIISILGERKVQNEFGQDERFASILTRRKKEKTGKKEKNKKPEPEFKSKTLTVKESEQLIKKSLKDKTDASFDVSADDIDELATKFPRQKLYLQVSIMIKIEAVPRYKAYTTVMDYLGKHWSIENVTDAETNKIYHVIRAKVSDMYYRNDLAQALIPLSRATKIQYRGVDYAVSEFKNAIYQYKEGTIDRLEDNFDVAKKNKVWEPANTKTVNHSIVKPLNGLNFVAFDFETANNNRSSACSIGLVLVKDGIITERIHRLINPGMIEWGVINIRTHGIKPDTVLESPTFPQVWEELEPYFKSYPVIAHNAASFDISVLRACLLENGITPPAMQFGCTMKGAKNLGWAPKLKDLCKEKGIELDHHNALSDAEACALIAISMYNESQSFEHIGVQEFTY